VCAGQVLVFAPVRSSTQDVRSTTLAFVTRCFSGACASYLFVRSVYARPTSVGHDVRCRRGQCIVASRCPKAQAVPSGRGDVLSSPCCGAYHVPRLQLSTEFQATAPGSWPLCRIRPNGVGGSVAQCAVQLACAPSGRKRVCASFLCLGCDRSAQMASDCLGARSEVR